MRKQTEEKETINWRQCCREVRKNVSAWMEERKPYHGLNPNSAPNVRETKVEDAWTLVEMLASKGCVLEACRLL